MAENFFQRIMKREEVEEIDDDMTRDRHLRSLRRENRMLDEEEEKKHLIKVIAAKKKKRLGENLFGKMDNTNSFTTKSSKQKQVQILRERSMSFKGHMFDDGVNHLKSVKTSILSNRKN